MMTPPPYQNRPFLGIDYGTVTTGLSLFHSGRDPWPLPAGKISCKSDSLLIDKLLQIIEEEAIEIVVLGLPFFTDRKKSPMTKKVEQFGEALKERLPPRVELHYSDETLTTIEAQDRMKSSPRYNFRVNPEEIDALSACIILEEFLTEK